MESLDLPVVAGLKEYPAIPSPFGSIYKDSWSTHGCRIPKIKLPKLSGIYFLWSSFKWRRGENWEVDYVGQAQSLFTRVTLAHEKIELDDLVSFIEWPMMDLANAERYYISVLTPPRNDKEYKKRNGHKTKPGRRGPLMFDGKPVLEATIGVY